MEPTLLEDKTRLIEICQLRVLAWEHSDYHYFINRNLYPNGWTDHLDSSGFHWIMENDKKEIIGSARFNILYKLSDLTEHELYNKFQYPSSRPFGFLSRLVIHPDYRRLKLSSKFDLALLNFSIQQNVGFSIVGIYHHGIKQLTSIGFNVLGKTYYNLFSDKKLAEEYVLIYENANHH